MSLITNYENDMTEPKNEIIISDLNVNDNHYCQLKSFKEEIKEGKSSSSYSNLTKIIQNQYIKEMTNKKLISGVFDSDEEYSKNDLNPKIFENFENITSFQGVEKNYWEEQEMLNKDYNEIDDENNDNISFNMNSNLSFSPIINGRGINNNINDISGTKRIHYNNRNKFKTKKKEIKKIFKVVKVYKYKEEKEYLMRKRINKKKKNMEIDWDNMPVPKEKHFHLDRKKKRIIFQRKYLKMIYSIVDLEYPFNFNELFNLIKDHVGDKTATNFGKGKSFHIIKIKDELIVVTKREKKYLLRLDQYNN